jgi:hypothetical protein
MENRPSSEVSRFRKFLADYSDLDLGAASTLLVGFARGDAVLCPVIREGVEPDDVWAAHEERASLIADHGLLHSQEEADAVTRAETAKLVAERRAAFNVGWVASGSEAAADALAADLTVSVEDARTQLLELREQRVLAIEERHRGELEMGGDNEPRWPFPDASKSTDMAAAVEKAAARRNSGVQNA